MLNVRKLGGGPLGIIRALGGGGGVRVALSIRSSGW